MHATYESAFTNQIISVTDTKLVLLQSNPIPLLSIQGPQNCTIVKVQS